MPARPHPMPVVLDCLLLVVPEPAMPARPHPMPLVLDCLLLVVPEPLSLLMARRSSCASPTTLRNASPSGLCSPPAARVSPPRGPGI